VILYANGQEKEEEEMSDDHDDDMAEKTTQLHAMKSGPQRRNHGKTTDTDGGRQLRDAVIAAKIR
jgi:hypothetical protein